MRNEMYTANEMALERPWLHSLFLRRGGFPRNHLPASARAEIADEAHSRNIACWLTSDIWNHGAWMSKPEDPYCLAAYPWNHASHLSSPTTPLSSAEEKQRQTLDQRRWKEAVRFVPLVEVYPAGWSATRRVL